jgi:predicted nucleic acid-binding protein
MGIVSFEKNRLKQKEIEVQALVALLTYSQKIDILTAVEFRLMEIAFPEELAEELERHFQNKQTKL